MENNTTHTENTHTAEHHSATNNSDNNNETLFAALAYIIFFLPLIFTPNSTFAKFHANQGLILAVCWFGLSFLLGITLIGAILIPFVSLGGFILIIMGILNASKNKKEPLPLIGNLFTVIK